jgi:hypothetical protein
LAGGDAAGGDLAAELDRSVVLEPDDDDEDELHGDDGDVPAMEDRQ